MLSWVGNDPERAFEDLVEDMNATPVPAPGTAVPTPVTGDELLFVMHRML